jgi:hypothetical protein
MTKSVMRTTPQFRRKIVLEKVRTADEIRDNLIRLNRDARHNSPRVAELSHQTKYWVFDEDSDTFAPNKFLGFRQMTFDRYEALVSKGQSDGVRFNGTVARNAIADLLGPYAVDPKLIKPLRNWLSVYGVTKLDGIDTTKWKFARLARLHDRGQKQDFLSGNKRMRHAQISADVLTEYDRLLDDVSEQKARRDVPETVRKQLIDARKGQGEFRKAVLRLSNRRCVVTGSKELNLLRASHIKPWRLSSDAERLDPNNGFLLSPNFDAAFDHELISFDDHGKIMISRHLAADDARRLGIAKNIRIPLRASQMRYLKYHRERFLRNQEAEHAAAAPGGFGTSKGVLHEERTRYR